MAKLAMASKHQVNAFSPNSVVSTGGALSPFYLRACPQPAFLPMPVSALTAAATSRRAQPQMANATWI